MQCDYVKMGYRKFLESAKHCMFQDAPSIFFRTDISLTVHGMFHKGYDPSKASLASRLLTYLSCMSGNLEVSKPKDRTYGVHGFLHAGDCHDDIFILMAKVQYEQNLAEFYHWVFFGSFLILNLNHTLYTSWEAGLVISKGYHYGFNVGIEKME